MFSCEDSVSEYAGGLILARSRGFRSGMLVGTYTRFVFGVPLTFIFAEVTLVLLGFEVSLFSEGMMNGKIVPSGRSVDATNLEVDCKVP